MLEPTLAELGVDWPIDDHYDRVVTPALADALAELWTRLGHLPPPSGSAVELTDYVLDVLKGKRSLGDAHTWHALIVATPHLRALDPMASVVAALCATAAWLATEDPMELVLRPRGDDLSDGFSELLIPTITVMRDAGAFWGARQLTRTAIDAVEWRARAPWSQSVLDVLAQLWHLSGEMENDYRDDVAVLAWALRGAIQDPASPDRRRLAATFWTWGDPARAHGLADGTYLPSLGTLNELIDVSLSIMRDTDPFLVDVWATIWMPGTQLRRDRHERLWRRSRSWATLSRHYRNLQAVIGFSPFEAYARALVAWFARDVTEDDESAIEWAIEVAQDVHPPSWVRLAALNNLLVGDAGFAQKNWRVVARRATDVARREHFTGEGNPYARFLDTPLYYLSGETSEQIYFIERHRRAGLTFWQWLTARFAEVPESVRSLVQEEEALVDETLALRLILQQQAIPKRFKFKYGIGAGSRDVDGAEGARPWHAESRAHERLQAHYDRLGVLTEELRGAAPDYAKRRFAGSTIDEFRDALHQP